MAFDPAEYSAFKASATPSFDASEFESFKKGTPKAKPDGEAADHGLSERQKLSPIEKAVSPITEYPATYERMNKEAREQVSRGVEQLTNPESLIDPKAHGISDVLSGVGNVAAGTLGYIASPISAAYRSVIGQPVEDVTGIPREYTEFAAQLVTPGIGLPRAGAPSAPKLPGFSAAPEAAAPAVREGIPGAVDRLADAGHQVDVPRAMASDSMAVQRSGQALRNVPIVGDAIPKATARLGEQIEDVAGNIASEYGGGSGPNVSHRIGQTIGTAAEQEAVAARAAAAQSDQAILAAWENNVRGANEAIAGAEAGALQRARQSVGDMSPQDMGETVAARLRTGEREAFANKERLYGLAGESDAAVRADSVQGVHGRVSAALDDMGRVVDAELTPAANRMMGELQNFSALRIPNRVGAPPPDPAGIVAVDARGMEQIRKRLSGMSQAANNDADRAASRIIMRQFDEWQADAYDNALFSGSPEALQVAREARAANASWRHRFYNDRDDADRVINRIVTGEVTPQEVSNYIIGATKVGSKGVSSRLLTRITEATAGDPEVIGAIRGGVWNKLSAATEGVTAKAGAKVADDIGEFFNGSGRDVAQRLFTEPQRAIGMAYSRALRQGAEARGVVADIAANTRPSPMEVGIGPLQRLANDVLGKGSGRSDEALYSAIQSYGKSGSKGDISLLSQVIQAIPQAERGNLAGALIKDMGVSTRTGQFSPDVFVSSWGAYKPEAKALLFGMAGPQRVALDDIAKISLRMKEVGAKFGNPSGTAQNVSAAGLGTTAVSVVGSLFMGNPVPALTFVSGVLGGAAVAKILSSPIGASSVSKWARLYERASNLPSVSNIDSYKRATGLLAINISRDTGMPIKDIIKQLQGPVPAAADKTNNQNP